MRSGRQFVQLSVHRCVRLYGHGLTLVRGITVENGHYRWCVILSLTYAGRLTDNQTSLDVLTLPFACNRTSTRCVRVGSVHVLASDSVQSETDVMNFPFITFIAESIS